MFLLSLSSLTTYMYATKWFLWLPQLIDSADLFLSPVLLLSPCEMQDLQSLAVWILKTFKESISSQSCPHAQVAYACATSNEALCGWSYTVTDLVSLTHLWPPSNVFWVFVISVEIAFLLSHLCVGLWLIRKNMFIFWREGGVLEFLIRVSCFNHPALLVPRHSGTGRWVWVWPMGHGSGPNMASCFFKATAACLSLDLILSCPQCIWAIPYVWGILPFQQGPYLLIRFPVETPNKTRFKFFLWAAVYQEHRKGRVYTLYPYTKGY